jgi:glucose-1-phosphate cytidylyltransferase
LKAVILAGGLGTRISEETQLKPKPMIEIGGKPILWHIMKSYAEHGVTDFIVCCGYMGYVIKEYFANYSLHNSDVTIDFRKDEKQIHAQFSEPWKVTLIDTGSHTMTGGRLLRVKNYIDDENFFLTYGDGLSDINISDLKNFHLQHKKIATLSSVFPPGRFGALSISEDRTVKSFQEKPAGDGGQINGGFFVFNKEIFNYLDDDTSVLEEKPLQNLAHDSQLMAFEHQGFWQPMDTLRDKVLLENLWSENKAPWKTWN